MYVHTSYVYQPLLPFLCSQQYAEAVVKYPTPIPTGGSLPEELVEAIKTLWGDAGVRRPFGGLMSTSSTTLHHSEWRLMVVECVV